MRIYVASSWRNLRQPNVVDHLRRRGHMVYDFREPEPGRHGFHWRECGTADQLHDTRRFRDEVLPHPVAQSGFESDMNALTECDACVLVLPCGRSAHLELGWAVGAKKRTIVLFEDSQDEPELMFKMCGHLVVTVDELDEVLTKPLTVAPSHIYLGQPAGYR